MLLAHGWAQTHLLDTRVKDKIAVEMNLLPTQSSSTSKLIISKKGNDVCIYVHWRKGNYKRISRHT